MQLSYLEQAEEMVAIWSETFHVHSNPDLYETLIQEESIELLTVLANEDIRSLTYATNYLKENADLLFVMVGFYKMVREYAPDYRPGRVTMALLDTLYNIHKVSLVRGAPNLEYLEMEAFRLVFESNMSKLGADGNPIYRLDGKIMKGPNYKEPDLTELASILHGYFVAASPSAAEDLERENAEAA